MSDGAGSSAAWCWDKHYVTYVKNGQALWTWGWVATSPWISAGATTYQFNTAFCCNPLPADVVEPTGTSPPASTARARCSAVSD